MLGYEQASSARYATAVGNVARGSVAVLARLTSEIVLLARIGGVAARDYDLHPLLPILYEIFT